MVSNVSAKPPVTVVLVNGRSKNTSKNVVKMASAPQKCPEVTEPRTSVELTISNAGSVTAVAPPPSLKTRFACVVAGYVNRAMPERVVAVSSVFTEFDSVTAYDPAVAASAAWLNPTLAVAAGAPVVGRIGTSPIAAQPGPDRCVRLKPVTAVSA